MEVRGSALQRIVRPDFTSPGPAVIVVGPVLGWIECRERA